MVGNAYGVGFEMRLSFFLISGEGPEIKKFSAFGVMVVDLWGWYAGDCWRVEVRGFVTSMFI